MSASVRLSVRVARASERNEMKLRGGGGGRRQKGEDARCGEKDKEDVEPREDLRQNDAAPACLSLFHSNSSRYFRIKNFSFKVKKKKIINIIKTTPSSNLYNFFIFLFRALIFLLLGFIATVLGFEHACLALLAQRSYPPSISGL